MTFATLNEVVTACGESIVRASFHASLIVGLVLLLQWVFRKWMTPGLRHALWLLVVLRLVIPIVPASSWSVFNLFARDPQLPSLPPPSLTFRAVNPLSVSGATLPAVRQTAPATPSGFSLRDGAAWVWCAGVFVLLALVWRRYRRIAASVNASMPVSDAESLSLLEACRITLRVSVPIRLLESTSLSTPAIFGVHRPCLLLPASLRRNLDHEELRLVFLHELMHLKRFDLLLDWLLIVVQAIHWFNPLAWLACKRLRADRELACDAAVLRRLGVEERQQYGRILIKLVEQFSPSPPAPGLLSVIQTETEIKRRILMISKFKPTPRFVTFSRLLVLALLALFTLTRAAEKTSAPPSTESANAELSPARSGDRSERGLQALQEELERNRREIEDRQSILDRLKVELGITEQEAQGSGEGFGATLRRLESLGIEARADYDRISTLYRQLTNLSRAELKATVTTTAPDPLLTSLMQKEAEVEQRAAEQGVTFASNSPGSQAIREVQKTIERQINDRLDGILGGLKARAAAEKKRVESLQEEMEKYQVRDIKQSIRRRPYFQAKRDVENLQFIRDRLQTRLWQERIDHSVTLTESSAKEQSLPADPRRVRTVDITVDGKYSFGGRMLSLDELGAALKQAKTESPDFILYIKALSGSPFKAVSALLDRCSQLGIDQVSLRTKP